MTPIEIASIVLVCIFGGALLGMLLRTIIPEQHLDEASKDVVRLVTGLIATLAALVLGLLIASAKNSFDTVNVEFRQSAAKVIFLDRTLAQYGPETKDLRDLLRRSYRARIDRFLARQQTLDAPQMTAAVEGIQQQVRTLAPQNDAQRSLQSRALDLIDAVAQSHWFAVEDAGNRTPASFLIVLVFWLVAMFAGFGLFAPRNAIAVIVLFLGALSLSAAIFLIEELNNPFDSFISILRTPLDTALAHLGQ